jgi:hypothetical protein
MINGKESAIDFDSQGAVNFGNSDALNRVWRARALATKGSQNKAANKY